jgi:hypothetical protein
LNNKILTKLVNCQDFFNIKIKDKLLWATYQAYNGGWKWLYLENKRAASSRWEDMKEQCQRKTITLKNGSLLSFCEVNYDYSKRISKYGQQYKTGADGMGFWEVAKTENKTEINKTNCVACHKTKG